MRVFFEVREFGILFLLFLGLCGYRWRGKVEIGYVVIDIVFLFWFYGKFVFFIFVYSYFGGTCLVLDNGIGVKFMYVIFRFGF